MPNERMQILRLIEEGKISAAEGAQLLRSLNEPKAPAPPPRPDMGGRARWLHVSITDAATGKQKVNITIPLGLVNVGLKMGARLAPDMSDEAYGDLLQSVQQAAETGQPGKLIETRSQTGDTIEVYVA